MPAAQPIERCGQLPSLNGRIVVRACSTGSSRRRPSGARRVARWRAAGWPPAPRRPTGADRRRRGDSMGRARSPARNGIESRSAAATTGSSSRFVRASTASVDAVRRPGGEHARGAIDVVRRGRGKDQAALRPRPGADRLRKALHVVLDEAHRSLEDRRRTSVVDLEVDAGEVRQRLVGKSQEPSHVREAPAVDRLVVVAHEEDAIGRRSKEEREAQLAAVEVLRLVNEEMCAAGAPRSEHGRVLLEEAEGARDEVVEVEATEPSRSRARSPRTSAPPRRPSGRPRSPPGRRRDRA